MNPVEVTLSLEPITRDISIGLEENTHDVNLGMSEVIEGGGTRDYRRLINKPKINNTELYDNYNEIDPTVHDWAKEPRKPSYTAEEVGALDEDSEMSLATVSDIWHTVFGRGGI